jgi:2-amino-4-hydroxy-6-hydroxymethyldihydropteridine diphosphokinase
MGNNHVILLLGSNIDPARNIQCALELLAQFSSVTKKSQIWITEAVGSSGPNFLNMAVEVETNLNIKGIKNNIIDPIEAKLKRIRTLDKYAPRTMDIDLIIFNNKVLDPNIWNKLFIALPVLEINSELNNDSNGKTLAETVEMLKSSAKAELFNNLK